MNKDYMVVIDSMPQMLPENEYTFSKKKQQSMKDSIRRMMAKYSPTLPLTKDDEILILKRRVETLEDELAHYKSILED